MTARITPTDHGVPCGAAATVGQFANNRYSKVEDASKVTTYNWLSDFSVVTGEIESTTIISHLSSIAYQLTYTASIAPALHGVGARPIFVPALCEARRIVHAMARQKHLAERMNANDN